MPTELRAGLAIRLFTDRKTFEAWLSKQGEGADGIWLRLPKKGVTALGSLTKKDAIDTALCHGWIDGQQHPYDEESWLTRMTPRKRRSMWSAINKRRALELIDEGRMHTRGQAEVDAARKDGRWDVAYESAKAATVPPDLQRALAAKPKAAKFFATLTGANRYAILYRIGAVKKAETRARKIEEYVALCARGEVLHPTSAARNRVSERAG